MESDMRPYEPSQKFPSIPQKFNYLSFISVLIFLLFSCQSFHSFFHIYFLSFFIFHIFDYVILVLKIRRRTFGNRKGRSTVASIKFICQNINTGCVACTGYWREMQNDAILHFCRDRCIQFRTNTVWEMLESISFLPQSYMAKWALDGKQTRRSTTLNLKSVERRLAPPPVNTLSKKETQRHIVVSPCPYLSQGVLNQTY